MKDRIVVITGAAGGFGRALVDVLAPQGARLALADLSAEALKELSARASELGASQVVTGVVDVTDEASTAAFFAQVKEAYGHADVLVNLPGMSIASPVAQMPVESYDKIIDVNLKGLFLATKHFIPLTDPERVPLIAFISSQAATRPNPNAPVYCAAKAAVSIFGQGLALQVMQHLSIGFRGVSGIQALDNLPAVVEGLAGEATGVWGLAGDGFHLARTFLVERLECERI